jgi:UDP-glucose 4-epimerase
MLPFYERGEHMKIAIIGGAGYIGSHVSRRFADAGHEILVFDNLSSGLKQNLFPDMTFIEGDILNIPDLQRLFEHKPEALVHLAAFKAAGESMIDPEKYSLNNITGTLNILQEAVKAKTKYFVFSSSAAVYGSPERLPIDEDHPQNPENYYGFTKLEIERFLAWYSQLRGIRFAALRYFNAAGYDPEGRISGLEQNPANLLPVIMEAAAGMREKLLIFGNDYPTRDGTGIRDYVHVTDLAEAHLKSLEYIARENKDLTVNLGSDTGISVLEMLESARKITKKEIKADFTDRRPGDPPELYATSKRAETLLSWKPQHSDVDSLVRTTWDAYLKNQT